MKSIVIPLVFLIIAGSSISGYAITANSSASTSSSFPSTFNNTSSTQPFVTIDRIAFLATVPSQIVIGQNYTVKVLVRNTLQVQVPMVIQLSVPVDVILVHPVLLSAEAVPGQSFLANFTIVAFNRDYRGSIEVNASVWLWPPSQSSPQLSDTVSAFIYGVSYSSYSGLILIFVGILIIVIGISVFYFTIRSRRSSTLSKMNSGKGESGKVRLSFTPL